MKYNQQEQPEKQSAEITKHNNESDKSQVAEDNELFENHAYLVFAYDVPEDKHVVDIEID